ncbi:hypothetical protein DeepPurple_gp030 [Bacillus phage Deep-Purple]|uniref:Holin n=2 Tax=root TaxID=1 RepID=A0A1Z1LZL7_9CAUD|nr:hypothetical protein HWB22_gp31 [Bacillus phage Deep-Purple]ARW58281.1 hypothetical protein DeepPurple_gp030 [Bacillus phage Deep-Purple]
MISKEELLRRLMSWPTIVAIVSLIGFLATTAGHAETKTFLDKLLPYVFAVGTALGIWHDHEPIKEDKTGE